MKGPVEPEKAIAIISRGLGFRISKNWCPFAGFTDHQGYTAWPAILQSVFFPTFLAATILRP